jgi:hypothetical protein
MRKILLLLLGIHLINVSLGQSVEITANAGTSATPALGSSNYVANESIYTETEIGASNFTSAATAINYIALSVNVVGTNTTFNNVKIYFKNVPLATTTFTTGTYTTTGYTEVFNGSINAGAVGWTEFALNTSFVRTAGTNLQVLIERTDNVAHTSYTWRTANGNHTGSTALTTRRYNGATALSGTTSLATSTFRQQMRFRHKENNDASLNMLYTLGKVPIPNNATRTDSVNISNVGINSMSNVIATLTISGANSFTSSKTISSLAINEVKNVVFDPYTLTNEGTNTYTVSLSSDDNNANNSLSISQLVNKNTWSYAYSPTASAGVGFSGVTGDFVAKFNTDAATAISQVSVNFIAGGQPFQIGIWDATGAGGTPGTNLYTSPTYTSNVGVNVLPINPSVSIGIGNYYIGVRQTGTTNVNFAYQLESPIRTQSFYYATPSGSTTWVDFAPASAFRLMIEPKLVLATDASVSDISTPVAVNSCLTNSETVTLKINNPGTNPIAAGAVGVTLKIRGANTFTGTASNTGIINSGSSETITFTGINLSNAGTNFDTAYISYTGDLDISNDTFKVSFSTASLINTFPVVDNIDPTTGLNVVNYLAIVSGTRQLWALQTGNYTNGDQTQPLAPRSGTRFMLFDAYSGASSTGFVSRLYSNCLAIPAASAGNCGYQLNFWMSHDNTSTLPELDSLYVSVSTNNGLTYTRQPIVGVGLGLQRHDATLTANASPIWRKETVDLSAFAGQTIKVAFEGVSKYGNGFGLDDVTIGASAVNNLNLTTATNNGINLIASCDNNGWTYYNDPADATKTFVAIQWDPSSTGANAASKAAAIPTIQLNPSYFAAEDIVNKKATYTMRRYWNVNLNSSTMTGPVNVRFFYNPAEKTEIETAATNFATANTGMLEPGLWFKTDGVDFVPNVTNVTPDFVNNSLSLSESATTGTLNELNYVQFNNVTSFSGGTFATGVGPSTPLPISITKLYASTTGATNTINWTTVSEVNSSKFVVERSINGVNYTAIGEVATIANNGNSSTALNYNFIDVNPVKGKQYYRLQMVDRNGATKYSQTVTVRRGGSNLEIVDVRPNPTTGLVYFNVLGVTNNVSIAIRNLQGQTVINKNLIQANGFSIDLSALTSGLYILEAVNTKTQEKAVYKLVKE